MSRDPNFDDYVMKIHDVLDRLDYYRLLGVEQGAGNTQIRKAFYAIAAKFHPDRNRDADPTVKKALYDIFKRLNEAYRVLCEPEHRTQYDKGLADGKVRLEQDNRRGAAPKNPEDTIGSREAREFYRQATHELEKGSIMQAELHIKMAIGRDRENEAIKELAEKIITAKQQKKKKSKQP